MNSAGFYSMGLYSSNMTGNVSALADHLALADLAGAATRSSASTPSASSPKPRYWWSWAGPTVALRGAGRDPLPAYGLSFLMGLQNAVVTRISSARVCTTHVTGMTTDIGIELGNLADLARQRRRRQGRDALAEFNRDKLRLHGFTVLSFLGGGVVGVLAYRRFGPYLLFGAALLLLLLTLSAIKTRRAVRRAGS